jgi:hypothetical protein
MRIFPVIGWILVALAAIVLLCLGVLWVQKRYPSEEFDERQKIAQGKASSLAMIVGSLYFVGISTILINQVENTKTVEPYLLVMIGIELMLMVDHTYCLLCHAALPFSQKGGTTAICYLIMGLVDIGQFALRKEWVTTLSWVGRGTQPLFYLLLGIGFLYLGLMHTIAWLRDRKETNE